jgi:hypothetical protein
MSVVIMWRTTLFSAMGAAAFCCAGAAFGQENPSAGVQKTDAPAATPAVNPPADQIVYAPKWLVLNGRVLSGDLLRDAGGYVFKSGGLTARLADGDVEVVADTREGLFVERRKRIDDKDFSERANLARWGMLHGMTEAASAEVEAILRDAPNFEPARKLQKAMRDQKRLVVVSGEQAGGGGKLDAVVGGFGDDALKMFTSRVQMILLNKCGQCHANPRHEGAFKLTARKPHFTPTITQRNFQAAEAMCDLRNPAKSKLLEMAITPHGDAKRVQAPFGGPRDPNYQELKKWVYALARNWQEGFSDDLPAAEIAANENAPAKRPQLAAQTSNGSPPKSKMKPAPNQPGFGSAAADDAPPTKPETMPTKRPSRSAKAPSQTTAEPQAKPKSKPETPPKKSAPAVDPFDPATFNGDDEPLAPTTKPKSPPAPASIPKIPAAKPESKESLYETSPWKPVGKS